MAPRLTHARTTGSKTTIGGLAFDLSTLVHRRAGPEVPRRRRHRGGRGRVRRDNNNSDSEAAHDHVDGAAGSVVDDDALDRNGIEPPPPIPEETAGPYPRRRLERRRTC